MDVSLPFTEPSAALETLLEEREIPFILLNRERPENNYVMIDSIGGMEKLVDAAWEKYGSKLRPCFFGICTTPRSLETKRGRSEDSMQ